MQQVTLEEFSNLNTEELQACKPEITLCKINEGSYKKVYKNEVVKNGVKHIKVYTTQNFSDYYDPIKTWKQLSDLDDHTKKYLLLPDTYLVKGNVIYAQFTYCESDMSTSMEIRNESLMLNNSSTRSIFNQNLEENFLNLEKSVINIHNIGLSSLDIKPENMLFKCREKADIVLTDLDGAGFSQTIYFTWFGLDDKKQDLFALYVSFLLILKEDFFSELPESKHQFLSQHYSYGQEKWINYCETNAGKLPQFSKSIAQNVINKIKNLFL